MNKLKLLLSSLWQDKLLIISGVGLAVKILLFYIFLGKNILEVKSLVFSIPGVLLVVFSIVFLFKTWSRKSLVILLNILVTFLLLSQLWYIRYFGTPLSFFALLQTSNLSGLGPSIVELIKVQEILFIIDIVVLLVLTNRNAFSIPKRQPFMFVVFLIIGMVLLTFKPLKNHYVDGIPYAQIFKIYDRYEYMLKYNPVQYSFLDMYLTYKNNRYISLTAEEENLVRSWFEKKDLYRKGSDYLEYPYKGAGEGKNLLLIQVESLENWVINKEVNGKAITPNLNSLLGNSIYASNFFPQTKGGRSSDAEFILNTSLFPVDEGSTFFRFPYNEYMTLPGLLKDKGYSTFAFHGDEATYWNRNSAYPAIDIDQYYAIEDYEDGEEIGMGLSDEEFFHQSVDFLSKVEQPYYGLLITLTSHTPFEIPEKYKGLEFDAKYSNTTLANYLQSIHYTDMAIGKLIDDLKNNNMLEDTVIAIYGDHAGFESRIKVQMMKENPEVSGVDELGRVPFIIYNPSFEGKEYKHYSGQIDMYPTLAYIMGVDEEKYENLIMGRNLLRTGDSFSVIPLENTIRSDSELPFNKKEFEMEALNISDLIIRSNYFKGEE
ncbi:LTA synthase family protein [Bacillus sp. SCS-153A]|uniref:LTA synthase family protein n=1 Tax=Rossellomorea sedimentorum TaxID=3115294 RepID=UPI003906A1D8